MLQTSKIFHDYRIDEGKKLTPEHVERWIQQFDSEYRIPILQ